MAEGTIFKALSGFYYVDDGAALVACRARGKFRHRKVSPLVGDRVRFTPLSDGQGALDEILPRKNEFQRPAVANIDQLVIIVSRAAPETDPFLIDRVTALAEYRECDCVICINKSDLAAGDELERIYLKAGFSALQVSALTGRGIGELRGLLAGKVSAFTGNSGVGKSSLLNALEPDITLKTGEISEKLGRGRHTTRHVELFRLSCGGIAADTPGFSSFDTERVEWTDLRSFPRTFREFRPYLGKCRFQDCAHLKEKGCAICQAVEDGLIPPSRHRSYARLYEQIREIPDWARE